MKLGKHQRSKQQCQYLCWKLHNSMRNPLFCVPAQCMNYITKTLLLVVFCVQVKGKKKEQKHTTEVCQVLEPFPSINYAGNSW